MNKEQMLEILKTNPIVAVLRGVTPDEVIDVCRVLADNGVKFAEVTMNSPEPTKSIKLAADYFAGSDAIHIGAGTVLTPEHVDQVKAAGGTYIISPNCTPAVIRHTKEVGLLSCPGVFTPSEAFTALENGADVLKLFPAGRMVPAYIKDMKAVAPTEFIATGAIDSSNFKDYLKFAAGIGMGSALFKHGISLEELARKAQELKI
jgi:2-dehydro-3-deoxyphosphogalactonate aldolase